MNKDLIVEWLKENHVPVTRRNYFLLNWLGNLDWRRRQDSEIEMSLPKALRYWVWRRRRRLAALRRQLRRMAK